MTQHLFDPLRIRGVTLRNRIAVSPMCQYASVDGFASDWHLVHLGSRAVGGAALVIAEATAVEARGRISAADLGIWKDEHIPFLKRVTDFIRVQGAVPGVQIAHAGRKASCRAPWEGGHPVLAQETGGWQVVAPSAVPFREKDPVPQALDLPEIADITRAFAKAAARAHEAGFEVLEIHAAHGYLLHEFLSPLSNRRTDAYGGAFENRARLVLEVTQAVRAAWQERLPLFVRISATDWQDGGWDIGEAVKLSSLLHARGGDLVECSSGALVPDAVIPAAAGYQVPFAERIRREAGVMTGAVGLITEAEQADAIICTGQADLILLARELLRDPYWPLHAAGKLGADVKLPVRYERAFAPHR